MNGARGRIEVLAPFNAALEWTKQILFRPFDLEKWLVIGFAAFLSHLAGGGAGFNFNPAPFRNREGWNFRARAFEFSGFHFEHGSILLTLALAAIVFIIAIAVVLLLIWIGCRGRFIFVDCVVRNRAAIREPWKEFHRTANSFFGFIILVAVLFIVFAAAAASPLIFWLMAHRGDVRFGPIAMLGMGLWIALVFVFALSWGLISHLMIVAMYRRRCSAMEAFRATVALIASEPVPFILYLLFLIVLAILAALASCAAACITCCIAALPYIGTVILLPLYVCLTAYPLLFARQFGSDWDAWADSTPPIQKPAVAPPFPPPPLSAPPVIESPPGEPPEPQT